MHDDERGCPVSMGADLEYWAGMPGWRTLEQAALLLGMNPDDKELLATNKPYIMLKRKLARAKSMGMLKSYVPPIEFLQWAKSNSFHVPSHLEDAVAKSKKIMNWKRVAKNQRKRLREYESMQDDEITNPMGRSSASMIILTMAKKYNYTPSGNDGSATQIAKEIGNTFRKPIKDTAVRRWFSEAEKLVGMLRKLRTE